MPLPHHWLAVSKKSAKIAELIAGCEGKGMDAHYLGYFECFNRQLFYEAHDVLEELWLADRQGPNYKFYKGLIQLAGAFVHLQKNRLKPSMALFRLAKDNISTYPAVHEKLDTPAVLKLISDWMGHLEGSNFEVNPLPIQGPPHVVLISSC